MNRRGLITLLLLGLTLTACQNSDYDKAQSYMNNGQYDKAMGILKS